MQQTRAKGHSHRFSIALPQIPRLKARFPKSCDPNSASQTGISAGSLSEVRAGIANGDGLQHHPTSCICLGKRRGFKVKLGSGGIVQSLTADSFNLIQGALMQLCAGASASQTESCRTNVKAQARGPALENSRWHHVSHPFFSKFQAKQQMLATKPRIFR